MIDRQHPGAAKTFAQFVIALAFATAGVRPAHAQEAPEEPNDDAASEPAASDAAPPSEPSAPKALPKPTTEASPITAVSEPPPANESWFERAPMVVSQGTGTKKWALTFYGFIEADYITDSTRSYGDAIGSALVARSDTYE